MLRALLLSAVAAGLAVLPLVLINLAAIPRLSKVAVRLRRAPVALPRVSIVIPARNEEREIARAVRSQLAQDYADFEVLVVDDRSTDATAAILAELARQDPRLTVIAGQEPPPGWLGKPHALHLGVQSASGEILLFADADVRYEPPTLSEAVLWLEEKNLDFLFLIPRLEAQGFWENVLMPNIVLALYFGPGFLVNLDRPRWVAAGGGAGNLIRRSVYERLGGHSTLRASVVDDVHLALKAKRAGFRTRTLRAEDRVAVRMYRGLREVWNGFGKNVAYVFNGVLGVALFLLTILSVLWSAAPPAVLLAGLLGADFAPETLGLAGAAFALAILARLLVALATGDPLWPSFTHPIMTAVWAGIACRSLYLRVIQRRLTWRDREFDARAARF